MNNLYHWHAEQMVNLEMKEIDRELEQARLLREAGISGTNWLASAFGALRNWLTTIRERIRSRRATKHPIAGSPNLKQFRKGENT